MKWLPRSGTGARRGHIPIAQHAQRLPLRRRRAPADKLPPKEHETLRATYERMLEKGPERFQVKPSGLPAMDHLYDELPNFAEVLDDVKRQLALCQDSRDALEITPMLLLGPPGIGKTHFARELVACCWAPAWASSSMSSLTAGWVLSGASSQWKGARPGKVFETLVDGAVRQPGDGGRRDRQGRRRTRLRPAGRAVQPARARHRRQLHRRVRRGRDRRQPGDLGRHRERRARDPRADPQPHERLRGEAPDREAARAHRAAPVRAASAPATTGARASTPQPPRPCSTHGRTGAARDAPRMDDRVRQRHGSMAAARSSCATCRAVERKRAPIGFVQ